MKRFSRISLTATLLFLLNIIFVHAATFDPVTAKLRYIFFNLSGTAAFAVWLKFAFFVIIFAVLYGAGSRVHALGEGPMRRALAVISFVIALTSAIFVPYTLLLYIFKMYHALLVVLFGILPALVGYLVASRIPIETDAHAPSRWGRVIRGFIYLLITVFIFGLIGQIKATSSPETELYMAILEPLMWGAIIAFVLGIFNLIMAMGMDTVVNAAMQRLGGHPAGAAPHAAGAPPGGAPAGAPQPAPPNPQQIQQLQQMMAQFHNAVFVRANNIEQTANNLDHGFRNDVLQLVQQQLPPPQQVTPQILLQIAQTPLGQGLHPIAQQYVNLIRQFQQQSLTPVRQLMERIFVMGQQTGQYQNVLQQVRDQFEQAVAAFVIHEAQMTDVLDMAVRL